MKNLSKFKKIAFISMLLLSSVSLFADDICYEKPYSEGFLLFTRTVLPIKSLSNNLKDVEIQQAIKGLSLGGFFKKIGIDNKQKTHANDLIDNGDAILRANTESSFDPAGLIHSSNVSFWDHGIDYNLGNMDKNDTHKTWTQQFIFTNLFNKFFSTTMLYVEYTKNGHRYHLNLNPCKDSGINVPEASIKDAFLPSPKVNTIMPFYITLTGTLDNGVTLDNNSYLYFRTEDGSAKKGIDYIPQSGVITIHQGEHSKTIKIIILANAHPGTFYVILENGYGVIRNDSNASGTILYRSLVKGGSKFWAGVGIKSSKNDVHRNSVNIDRTIDINAKKQLFNKMNW